MKSSSRHRLAHSDQLSVPLTAPLGVALTAAQRRDEQDLRWFLRIANAAVDAEAPALSIADRIGKRHVATRLGVVGAALARLPKRTARLLSGAYQELPRVRRANARTLGLTALATFASATVERIGGVDAYFDLAARATRRMSTMAAMTPLTLEFLRVRSEIEQEIHEALVAFGRARRAHARLGTPVGGGRQHRRSPRLASSQGGV